MWCDVGMIDDIHSYMMILGFFRCIYISLFVLLWEIKQAGVWVLFNGSACSSFFFFGACELSV